MTFWKSEGNGFILKFYVFDFSHQYDYFREQADYYSDCSFIPGTNAYCSDEATEKLRAEVSKALSISYCSDEATEKLRAEVSKASACHIDKMSDELHEESKMALPLGIHFIDSGNYHYMTLFFLERITTNFNLFLIDNHTDMNENAFGDILSCGNWVRRALLTLPHLKNVYMLGIKKQYFQEMKDMLTSEGELIENPEDENELLFTNNFSTGSNQEERIISESKECESGIKKIYYAEAFESNIFEKIADEPLYISLDKDALSEEYAVTDWDQGRMNFDDLEKIFSGLNQEKIIGLDICGDTKEGASVNQDLNLKIISCLRKKAADLLT